MDAVLLGRAHGPPGDDGSGLQPQPSFAAQTGFRPYVIYRATLDDFRIAGGVEEPQEIGGREHISPSNTLVVA